jgi:hypothetical protein
VQYMAAELLRPGHHKPEADMFSLGISLFQLVWGQAALPKSGHEWHALRNGAVPACTAPNRSAPLQELAVALMHPVPHQRPTAEQVAAMPQVQAALQVAGDAFLHVFDPVQLAPSRSGSVGASFGESRMARSGSMDPLLCASITRDMQAATAAADNTSAAAARVHGTVSGTAGAQHSGSSMASTTTPFKVLSWDDEEKLDAGGAPMRPSARARGYLRHRSGSLMSHTPVPCALGAGDGCGGVPVAPVVPRAIKALSAPPPPPEASSHPQRHVAWAPRAPTRGSVCDNSDEDIAGVARPLDFALGVGTPAATKPRDGAPPSTGRGQRSWAAQEDDDDSLQGGHVLQAARRRLSGIAEEGWSSGGDSSGSEGGRTPQALGFGARQCSDEMDGVAPSPIAACGPDSPTDVMGGAATPFTRMDTVSGRAKTKARTSGCLTPPRLDDSCDSDRMVQSAAKRMAMMTLSPGEEELFTARNNGAAPPRAAVPMAAPAADPTGGHWEVRALQGTGAARSKRSLAHMHLSTPMTACVATALAGRFNSDDEDDDERLSSAVIPHGRTLRELHCDVELPNVGFLGGGLLSSRSSAAASLGGHSRPGSTHSLDSINSNVRAQVGLNAPAACGGSVVPGFKVPALRVPPPAGYGASSSLSPSAITPRGYITPMAQGTDNEYHWAN